MHEGSIRASVCDAKTRMFHFFSKATNTNARVVGVRVGRDAGLSLPYVSVRCLVGRGLCVPFTTENPSKRIEGFSSVIVKNANGEDWRETQAEKSPPIILDETEKHFLRGIHDEPDSYMEDRGVDVRMRQILLPDGNGGYVGVVPMQSMPLAHMAQNIVWELPDDGKHRKLPSLDYPVGGGVPRTAGLETGFRKLVVTGFYRSNAEASRKASARHRGVARQLQMDMDTLKKYGKFIATCDWSRHEEAAHKGYVWRIVSHYLRQAEQIAESVTDDDIEGMESDFDKGFLDMARRGPAWNRDFVDWVCRRMKNVPTHTEDGQPQYLSGVDDHYLQKIIRGVIS